MRDVRCDQTKPISVTCVMRAEDAMMVAWHNMLRFEGLENKRGPINPAVSKSNPHVAAYHTAARAFVKDIDAMLTTRL